MSRQIMTATRADGTRSTYSLQPGSTVPMQLEALKPLKPTRIKADRRTYPKHKPGMSTAEYVALYEGANNSGMHCGGFWQPLNTVPGAGYTGLDSVEHGDFEQPADDAAPVVAMDEPAPAELEALAPVVPAVQVAPASPALQAWQAVAARAGVDPVATDAAAAAMAGACLARYGSTDPAACVHLASFAAWHADTLQQLRAAAAPELAPAAPPAADPAPWRGPDNAAARARVYAVHVRTGAAAQALAPTWHADGCRLRRSVNAPGFDSASQQLRDAVAAALRAERAPRPPAPVAGVAPANLAPHRRMADALAMLAAAVAPGQGRAAPPVCPDPVRPAPAGADPAPVAAAAPTPCDDIGAVDGRPDSGQPAAQIGPGAPLQRARPAPGAVSESADTCEGMPCDDIGASTAAPAGALSAAAVDWLARVHKHLETDPMPRAGYMLAAQSERERAARIHGENAAVARECAEHLQACADALPSAPVPALEHAAWDGFGGAWESIRNGRAEPDQYRARVMEAMEAAKAAGLFYNSETYPRAAAVMAARWGYPDLREAADIGGPDCDGVPRWFASHCYMANDATRAREAREAAREAREALRLVPGVELGALVFSDYKLTRSAEVSAVSEDGELITIEGNRGATAVHLQCSPLAVRQAIERAHEKGKRPFNYEQFCVLRAHVTRQAAPPAVALAAAIAEPVACQEPASQAEPGAIASARRMGGDDWHRGDAMRNEAAMCSAGRWSSAEWAAYCEGYEAAADAAACADDALARVHGDSVADAVAAGAAPPAEPAPVQPSAADGIDKRAAHLAAVLVGSIGTDPARLAPALRRESARVARAAEVMPAQVASSYRRTAARLAEMAAEEEARATSRPDPAALVAELDSITAAARDRMGGRGGAELAAMTPAERARRHALLLQLPTMAEERQAARARVAARQALARILAQQLAPPAAGMPVPADCTIAAHPALAGANPGPVARPHTLPCGDIGAAERPPALRLAGWPMAGAAPARGGRRRAGAFPTSAARAPCTPCSDIAGVWPRLAVRHWWPAPPGGDRVRGLLSAVAGGSRPVRTIPAPAALLLARIRQPVPHARPPPVATSAHQPRAPVAGLARSRARLAGLGALRVATSARQRHQS